MLLFAGVLIALLWLCQVVYLEGIYKLVKTQEAKAALAEAKSLVSESTGEAVEVGLEHLAEDHELCILLADREGTLVQTAGNPMGATIRMLSEEELVSYYERVRASGGTLVFTSHEETRREELPPLEESLEESGETGQPFRGPIEDHLRKDGNRGREGMVCASLLETGGQSLLVLVDVRLTPVDATVRTLRLELAAISLVTLLLALGLALLVSRAISTPIIKVNEGAKALAAGRHDVSFEGRGYREINELSDTLNYAAQELSKTERYQQELIANVSHDLRTPLTMITAYAEVMRDLPGENGPENVQVIIDEAERLTELVNDLLDVSKLQAGELVKHSSVYDLTESIDHVLQRFEKLTRREGYCIRFERTEHVLVDADEEKIHQVLYNFINNAINHTGEDKLVTVRQIGTRHKVRIEVEDTGPGIPKEELGNVWERYYKAGGNHRRAVNGTGLGLSIVRSVLDLHGADYGVESEEGMGSRFWFELERVWKEKEYERDG